MENKINKIEYLTCRVVQEGEAARVNIGTDRLLTVETGTELPTSKSGLVAAPLMPYRNEFESRVYAAYKEWSGWSSELEKKREEQQNIRLVVVAKLQKELLLASDRYPNVKFRLELKHCLEGTFARLEKGDEVEARIISLNVVKRLVNVKTRFEQMPLEEVKKLINRKVQVTVNGFDSRMGVFVDFKGYIGIAGLIGLHYRGAQMEEHYKALIGKTMELYLYSIDEVRKRLMFSENTLYREKTEESAPEVTMQVGDVVEGVPNCFHSAHGIYVVCQGVSCLVKRVQIAPEVWNKLPERYTLGETYKFRVKQIKSDPRRIYLSLWEEDKEQSSGATSQRLIREVDEGLPLGVERVAIPYDAGLYGLLLQCENYLGMLTYHHAPRCIAFFQKEILAKKLPFTVKVEAYEGKYSFSIAPRMSKVMAEIGKAETLRMRVEAIAAGGELLLSYQGLYAGIFFQEAVWKNTLAPLPRFEQGEEIEVGICKETYTPFDLEVSLVPTRYNPWMISTLEAGQLVDAEVIKVAGDRIEFACQGLVGELEPRFQLPGYTYRVSDVLQVLVVSIDRSAGILYLAHNRYGFANAFVQDLSVGDDCLVDVVEKMSPTVALAELEGKYALVRFDALNELTALIISRKKQPFTQLQVRIASISEWGTVVLEADGRWLNGVDYNKFVKGNVMECLVEEVTEEGYALDCHGIPGLLPFTEIEELWSQMTSYAVGDRLTVAFLGAGTVRYPLLFSMKLLTEEQWRSLELQIGQEVDVKVVGVAPYAVVAYQGVLGTIQALDLSLKKRYVLTEEIAIGEVLRVEVLKLNVRKRQLMFSRRNVLLRQWAAADLSIGKKCKIRVKKRNAGMVVDVDYDGLPGVIADEYLGWSLPALTKKLWEPGSEWEACILSVDEETHCLYFNARLLQENPWNGFPYQAGDQVKAEIKQFSGREMLLDVEGILTVLDKAAVCRMAGKQELVPLDTLPWKAGDTVEVGIVRLDRQESILEVEPVAPPIVFQAGDVCRMQIQSVQPTHLEMTTYLGKTYNLPSEEASWFTLSDLRGLFVRGKELRVTLLEPGGLVSLKATLPDPWKTFCYGHQFRAAVKKVLTASLVFVWEENNIQLASPEALHIPPEYAERIDLKKLVNVGEEFDVRVLSFHPAAGEMKLGLAPFKRVPPIACYEVKDVLENETVVRGEEGWGIVACVLEQPVGAKVWLALERQDEYGFLYLTPELHGHAVELYKQVLTCRPVAKSAEYMELRSEACTYLSLRLPWQEWSWTALAAERPQWEAIAETAFSVEVTHIDASEGVAYVSRKALEDDPRRLDELKAGDVCGLTVGRVSAKMLEVSGKEFTGTIPVEEWNWHRLADCPDLFRTGDRIRARVTALNPEEKTVSLSLKRVCPNPWETVQASWHVGDVLNFTVCQLTDRHLFLQREGLIIPVVAADVYWQAGNQFLFDYTLGQVVKAKITAKDVPACQISLSLRELSANPLETTTLPEVGDVVEGYVSKINNRHVFVQCGQWIVRVMPDDLVWGILQEKIEPYQIGQRVRCLVQQVTPERGTIMGSIRDLLPQPERQYPIGEICMTTICQFVPQGILLNYEGYKGFIPLDDIPFALDEIKEVYQDRTQLWAYLKEVDFKHHKLIFSLEEVKRLLCVGDCGKARVVKVEPEGVEVLFHQIPVSIPAEELDWRPLEDLSLYFRPDEEIEVRITRLQVYYNELALSVKQTIPNPWLALSPAPGDTIETSVHHTSLKMIYFAYKGLWGKIPYKEALWQAGHKLSDHYASGQPIRCQVTEFDPANCILKASILALQADPFDRLPFGENEPVELTVTHVGLQGLRVLAAEWMGYLPYEEFAWFELDDPAAVYAVGDRLTAICQEINRETHSIFFSLRRLAHPGQVEEATVKEVRKEGIQVDYRHLPGFIPNEELCWTPIEDASILFHAQDKVKVQLVAPCEEMPDKETAFLSVKRATADPWKSVAMQCGDVVEGKVIYRDRKNLYLDCRGLIGKIAYGALFWQVGHNLTDRYEIGQPVSFQLTELDTAHRTWKGSVIALQEDILQCLPFEVGDKVRVEVHHIGGKGIHVKTGAYLGYIPFEEYDWEPVEHPEERYKTGEEIEAVCKKIDRELRNILFSVRMLTPDPLGGHLPGDRIKATLVAVRDSFLEALTDAHIRAVIPKEETSWKYRAGYPYPVSLPDRFAAGQEVDAVVTEVDRNKKELTLSIKALREDPCLSCREGDVVDLTVVEVLKKNQLLVEWENFIGSMMKHQAFYQRDVRLLYIPGEKLTGQILKVNPDDRRIFVTAKSLYPDPFADCSSQTGDIVSARIIKKGLDGLLVELDNRIRSLIPLIEIGYRYEEMKDDSRFRTGDRVEARITAIDKEAKTVSLSLKELEEQPLARQDLIGSDRDAWVLSEQPEGVLVQVDGWLGWIPESEIGYKDVMLFEQRSRLDTTRPYRARITGFDERGTLQVSLKALLPDPYEKYRLIARKEVVSGRVYLRHKAGFFVELEDAVAYISQKNLTWNALPDWQDFFEINHTYDFKILHVGNEMITLTCLEDLPFDEEGKAPGIIIRKDERKVYLDVCGLEMFVSGKDASLDLFNTALGGRDIREGTAVIVKRKKVDYKEHFIQVSVVAIV